jgi:hypothetical protein
MVKLSDIEYQAILDNEKCAVNELTRMRAELAEARKDGERLEWAWAYPEAFATARRTTPPNLTGRQQLDRYRGTR